MASREIDLGGGTTLDIQADPEAFTIAIKGYIDDKTNFDEAVSSIERFIGKVAPEIRVNMRNMKGLDPKGISNWINFVTLLEGIKPLNFINTNYAIIKFASVVPGIFGKNESKVTNLDLPYYCQTCEEDQTKNMNLEDIKNDGITFEVPELKCRTCKRSSEFAALPDEFFFPFSVKAKKSA